LTKVNSLWSFHHPPKFPEVYTTQRDEGKAIGKFSISSFGKITEKSFPVLTPEPLGHKTEKFKGLVLVEKAFCSGSSRAYIDYYIREKRIDHIKSTDLKVTPPRILSEYIHIYPPPPPPSPLQIS